MLRDDIDPFLELEVPTDLNAHMRDKFGVPEKDVNSLYLCARSRVMGFCALRPITNMQAIIDVN